MEVQEGMKINESVKIGAGEVIQYWVYEVTNETVSRILKYTLN